MPLSLSLSFFFSLTNNNSLSLSLFLSLIFLSVVGGITLQLQGLFPVFCRWTDQTFSFHRRSDYEFASQPWRNKLNWNKIVFKNQTQHSNLRYQVSESQAHFFVVVEGVIGARYPN
jgi:hypothetical protein